MISITKSTNDIKKVKLGSICKFEQGTQISLDEQENEYKCGNIKFIRIENYTRDSKDFRYVKNNNSNKIVSKEDVVVVRYGATAGYIGRGIEGVLANNLFRIIPNNEVLNDYLYFVLKSDKAFSYFQKNMFGGAMPALNFGIVSNLDILILPLHEQQKIVSIISTWDKAIELKYKLIEEKKKQKKGLMQKLLTGKLRLQSFDMKWKEVRLEDIFERVTRKNIDGNKNVLTISAQRGLINQEDYFNKSVASSILDNYYLLLKDEFAYNKSYSNGSPMGAIKRLNTYDSGVVTTLYICFALKDITKANSDFFEQLFESGLLNEGLIKVANEGGRAHGLLNVSPKDFFNITIKIPTKEEQDKIALVLCCADNEINLLEQELEALKLQKKGLMQLLLTGIVRVNTEN